MNKKVSPDQERDFICDIITNDTGIISHFY